MDMLFVMTDFPVDSTAFEVLHAIVIVCLLATKVAKGSKHVRTGKRDRFS